MHGSIVALITPFKENREIDWETFDRLVLAHIDAKTDGIVCCGTTGEGPTLSLEEKFEICKRTVFLSKGIVPIIAYSGTNCTKTSVIETEKIGHVGVDGVLTIVPYYNLPTPEGCLEHFKQVADVGLPLIVYHHPKRTGIKLDSSTLLEIIRLPNVIGIKEASTDLALAKELIEKSGKAVFSGDDANAISMMKMGGSGVISVIANLIPEQWRKMADSCLHGDFATAEEIYAKHADLLNAISLEVNPQGIKCAMAFQKMCAPFHRLPMLEARETTRDQIAQAMQSFLEVI